MEKGTKKTIVYVVIFGGVATGLYFAYQSIMSKIASNNNANALNSLTTSLPAGVTSSQSPTQATNQVPYLIQNPANSPVTGTGSETITGTVVPSAPTVNAAAGTSSYTWYDNVKDIFTNMF